MNAADHDQRGLQIKDLGFGYHARTPVLSGYSLRVRPGQVHCVLGSSGGGKTTLLRLIAGLERARTGHINIDGETMAGPNLHVAPERRPIGLVFQDYALFPNRNVLKNILFAMNKGSRPDRKDQAMNLLQMVGLTKLATRMPHTLSGGQQQRVAIARALARKPRVMLLDEPFSSLDADTRQEIRTETIGILKHADVATLMVTHDPKEAEMIADQASSIDENAA